MSVQTMYALTHATCGHACAVLQTRDQANALHGVLAAAGYYRWRVQRVPSAELEAIVTGLVESDPTRRGCGTCRIDVDRAAALLAAGQGGTS